MLPQPWQNLMKLEGGADQKYHLVLLLKQFQMNMFGMKI